MTSGEIALQILKFVALGVSTASGWYATLSDTRDKTSGKLTRAGRIVFTCLILSSVVALLSQTLETKNTSDKAAQEKQEKQDADDKENAREKAAEDARIDELTRLSTILGTAEEASTNSQAAAKQSAEAVSRLARVIDHEELAKENTWRAQRPFGTWLAGLQIYSIPVMHFEKQWAVNTLDEWKNSHNTLPENGQITIDKSYEYTQDYCDSKTPKDNAFLNCFSVRFQLSPSSTYSLDFYPQHARTIIHFDHDGAPTSVDIGPSYASIQRHVSAEVTNWVDLYGSIMTFSMFGPAARGYMGDLDIVYKDTIAPHGLSFDCEGHCKNRLFSGDTKEPLRMMQTFLTDDNLGAIPSDYKTLFPKGTEAIRARIQEARKLENSR